MRESCRCSDASRALAEAITARYRNYYQVVAESRPGRCRGRQRPDFLRSADCHTRLPHGERQLDLRKQLRALRFDRQESEGLEPPTLGSEDRGVNAAKPIKVKDLR